jgi:phospholipid-binding lipoprotein MlaA
MRIFPALLAIFMLTACMQNKKDLSTKNNTHKEYETIKPINEAIFSFNLKVDEFFLNPVSKLYHYIPDVGRKIVDNVLTNLNEPENFINGVLQLNSDVAFASFWRFMINTTIGIGGVNDFASLANLKYQDESFEKTLAIYGFSDGQYIVLPILGPSTTRDIFGLTADWFLDPLGFFETTPVSISQFALDTVSTRDETSQSLDNIYYNSSNSYDDAKDFYYKNRGY